MNRSPLTVLAHMRARPGMEPALRALLVSLVGPTRLEEGCLNYDLHQSVEDSSRFCFHENWRSQADLDRHLQSAHIAVVRSRLPDLVAESPQITLWARVA